MNGTEQLKQEHTRTLMKIATNHGFKAYRCGNGIAVGIPTTWSNGTQGLSWEFAGSYRQLLIVLGY